LEANNSVQHSKGNQQAEDEANKDADKQIQAIKEAGKKSQAGVVQNLLKAVLEANPAPREQEKA
jgi:V-type H+-transporting ATPase subunit G